jgi:hypothetical protein
MKAFWVDLLSSWITSSVKNLNLKLIPISTVLKLVYWRLTHQDCVVLFVPRILFVMKAQHQAIFQKQCSQAIFNQSNNELYFTNNKATYLICTHRTLWILYTVKVKTSKHKAIPTNQPVSFLVVLRTSIVTSPLMTCQIWKSYNYTTVMSNHSEALGRVGKYVHWPLLAVALPISVASVVSHLLKICLCRSIAYRTYHN